MQKLNNFNELKLHNQFDINNSVILSVTLDADLRL